MYNLYIYSNNRTIAFMGLSYRDCLINLYNRNVKTNFKVVRK